MGMLDHWHPALISSQLRRKPVGVRIAGREIVLFRTATGQVGALDDICPHRRMRLSLGAVIGEKLRCKYHGWTYDTCGAGESPGTPKLHACATTYDTREEHDLVWVKPQGVTAEFPSFDVAGWFHACSLEHSAKAPLELVMDNFCEIEHTPTTHAMFGYPLERMQEVQVRFESTDTTVRVINHGPPKKLNPLLALLLGVKSHYQFNDDWTTFFSPPYSIYEHWWSDPVTGTESKIRWKLFIFFTPVDDGETRVTTLAFTKSRYPFGPHGGVRPFQWMMRRMLNREINLDVDILEGLASKDAGIDGMKLSRFDRVLGLNRERIERVYRGRPGPLAAMAGLPDVIAMEKDGEMG